ncbi:hypothetical protein ZHAS_00018063 [Anopheles sinensis]|uniref:Uncharacterized protein n=1 Tax=Anopheles sinensis TaxID=74873 RepID=A0A084WIH6_ANOSI|nr:hypothetical protein ZHAS_00018063 [Anopheles sinensis]
MASVSNKLPTNSPAKSSLLLLLLPRPGILRLATVSVAVCELAVPTGMSDDP